MNFVIIGVLFAVTVVGVGARFLFKKTDNPVEEIAERIIENKTGFKVDLSPDTPDPEDKLLNVKKEKGEDEN